MEDYLFQMALIFDVRKGRREEFKNFFLLCQQEMSRELSAILYFPFSSEMTEVKSYLIDNGLSLKGRLKIQSSFRRKRQLKRVKESILSLINQLSDEEKLKSPGERHVILKQIREISVQWWRRLFSLLVATEAKNGPWALELKRELAKSSPYTFLIKGLVFNEKERTIILDFILKVLKKYRDGFSDIEGVKILAQRFTSSTDSSDFKVIRNRMDADWSLTELRENFKNPLLRSEFFDFWYMVMMNRTSSAEVRSSFRKAFTTRSLKTSQNGQLWVLEYFFPPSDIKRDIIFKRMKDMWLSPNLIDQYTVLRVMRLMKVKKIFSDIENDFKRAEFQIKRDYYTKLLHSGFSTNFALYQLYFLGDKNYNNLWWLIL